MLSIEKRPTSQKVDKLSNRIMNDWESFRKCTSAECGFCNSKNITLSGIIGTKKIEKKYKCSDCNREWVI